MAFDGRLFDGDGGIFLAMLTQLEALKLVPGPSFEELPEGISSLISLRTLDLSLAGFSSVVSKLPQIGALSQLQRLDLSGSFDLAELPSGFSELTALQNLFLARCFNVNSLPDAISNLALLETLDVSHCGIASIPEAISSLTRLKDLKLNNASASHWVALIAVKAGADLLQSPCSLVRGLGAHVVVAGA